MHQFFTRAQELAQKAGAGVVGCGHAGDGNVHLAVFCGDDDVRHRLLHDIFAAAMELGGAISGEHGLGRIKMRHFLELEDPVKIALMRRIKNAFDPAGVLNPGALLDTKGNPMSNGAEALADWSSATYQSAPATPPPRERLRPL